MPVRSAQLCSQTIINATPVNLFTVPSGEIWLVKTITCVSAAGGIDCYVGRNTPGAGTDKNLAVFQALLAGIPQRLETWWALPAGNVLQAIRTAGANCRITIDGAKLVL